MSSGGPYRERTSAPPSSDTMSFCILMCLSQGRSSYVVRVGVSRLSLTKGEVLGTNRLKGDEARERDVRLGWCSTASRIKHEAPKTEVALTIGIGLQHGS